MPYIKPERRWVLLSRNHVTAESPGELNFQFSALIQEYVGVNGLSYQVINDILGALDGAGKEFYRRVAAPYEDGKIRENGDVY